MSIVFSRIPFSGEKFRVTSYYGKRGEGYHWGIDLGIATGTYLFPVNTGTVKAIRTGKKTFPKEEKKESNAAFSKAGYGNYVVVEHDWGFCTLYAHMSRVDVEVGQVVTLQTILGLSGDSGHSYGSHLHFEVIESKYKEAFVDYNYSNRVKTYNRNPLDYLLKVGQNVKENVSAANEKNYVENFPIKETMEDYEKWYDDTFAGLNNEVALLRNPDGTFATYNGARLFGRKYRIVVYDQEGNGIDISDLHVKFNCKKTMSLDNSVSHITVYNLNSSTEGQIIQYARKVSIEAGYDNLYGLIFEGDVIQAIRSKENATDYKLEIIAMDGDRFQSSAFNSYSIIRGQTMREALNNAFIGSSFKVNVDDSLATSLNDQYIRGKIVFGKAYDNTQNLISSVPNGIAYTEDGTTYLTKISDEFSQDVIDLDYDSGLIDIPSQSEFYVDFKALLNPKIKLNRLVHIKAEYIVEAEYSDGNAQYSLFEGVDGYEANSALYQTVNHDRESTGGYTLAKELGAQYTGVFRVVEINFQGDTRGNDWFVDCRGVKQTGSIPGLMAGYNASTYR